MEKGRKSQAFPQEKPKKHQEKPKKPQGKPKIQGLPKKLLLRQKNEIQQVFHKGEFYRLGFFCARSLKRKDKGLRFLISVKKSLGHAPFRNRVRRWTKDILRKTQPQEQKGHDVCFFMARKPTAKPPSYPQLQEEIHSFLQKLNA